MIYESFDSNDLTSDSDSDPDEFQLWLRQKIDNVVANGYPKDEVENFCRKNLQKLKDKRPKTAEIIEMILIKRRKKESDKIAKNLIANATAQIAQAKILISKHS